MTPKQQALKDLDYARIQLSTHLQLAGEEFNPKFILTRSVRSHPFVWIGVAAAGGLLIVRFLMPPKHAKIERDNLTASATKSGLIALILTPVIAMARQTAWKYGSQFLQSYLTQHFSRHEGEHPRG
ncbi:hypothetical protein EI77_03004 [Prosthecobacter fusiformis]|uniref:Uncharacterized protein n=1 Tax=Prosthecobacter fusiformis TaxID=48464 RepID=A0A4R7RUK7_9BACT|nr:hypothetical protein [Prosthecobacter fusiformis]TDU69351.1 hypothetical protein EI77_03004 [Prosthecobacter fusiformis]